jgi:excisionase family DNA binding protein
MDAPLLLSKRRAARLLGIGRDTLAELVKAGHLRTVSVLDHEPRIAREECERFAREGTGPAPSVSPVPLPKRRAAAALRSLREEFR